MSEQPPVQASILSTPGDCKPRSNDKYNVCFTHADLTAYGLYSSMYEDLKENGGRSPITDARIRASWEKLHDLADYLRQEYVMARGVAQPRRWDTLVTEIQEPWIVLARYVARLLLNHK